MMKYSRLSHEIEIMRLNHEHELKLLKMKQDVQINELISACTHTYEDGTSARQFGGTQWDSYYTCGVCKKNIQ